MDINNISRIVHDNAKAHGFHPTEEHINVFLANQINNLHLLYFTMDTEGTEHYSWISNWNSFLSCICSGKIPMYDGHYSKAQQKP